MARDESADRRIRTRICRRCDEAFKGSKYQDICEDCNLRNKWRKNEKEKSKNKKGN